MEFFKGAKVVRLRSQHYKYLTASEDEEAVKQTRNGSSKSARWSVEPVEGKPNVIRLKNFCSWKYLSASEEPFLLGWTGKRVLQRSPRLRLDSTVEWEPFKEGSMVKLRTCIGSFLRGNGGLPPWNNSVTHDVPSRSATLDWILWSVDVVEVDHQSMEEVQDHKSVVDDSIRFNVEDLGSLSRKSSCSSATTTEEVVNDFSEVESPVASTPKSARSVRSYFEVSATPSPRESPTASERSNHVSPLVQRMHNESQHSNSFNKLKSMLDGVQDLLDGTEEDDTKADAEPDTSAEFTSQHPHQLEVKMAKQTLKELKNMDFETMLSTGRDKKMNKSISILIADAKVSPRNQIMLKDLINLQDQLKSMRNNHDSANQDLAEYKTFATRRLEIKAELKKDAAKAHELETLEDGFSNMLATARAKRERILKQLEEVENSIKAAERTQAENAVGIEELITRIGENSQSLREMERNEKSWQVKKVEAERTLESVEEEWVKLKSLLQDV